MGTDAMEEHSLWTGIIRVGAAGTVGRIRLMVQKIVKEKLICKGSIKAPTNTHSTLWTIHAFIAPLFSHKTLTVKPT